MIFGKYINRYYLKYALWLILGLAALVVVDAFQLIIPNFYQQIVNGINSGLVIVDGQSIPFDLNYLLDSGDRPAQPDV